MSSHVEPRAKMGKAPRYDSDSDLFSLNVLDASEGETDDDSKLTDSKLIRM